jgi:CheY-like chemotaxis protein
MSVVSPKTILVVDDNGPARDALALLLRLGGYRSVVANDGDDGLQSVERHHPDLVLLDMNMPKVDGVQVLKKLRSDPRWQQLPVVFFSGVTDGPLVEKAGQLHVDDYILKGSVSGWELLARIARQLPTC